MNDPNLKRFTRISNPVTPTIHTFSESQTNPGKMTRVSNSVTPTFHACPSVPVLRVSLKRHPESDNAVLPFLAAQVIAEISRLEESFGGHGVQYDPAGSSEEPAKLVLRLFPKLIDAKAADRLAKVAGELNRLSKQARDNFARQQETGLRALIERALDAGTPSTMMTEVDEAIVA